MRRELRATFFAFLVCAAFSCGRSDTIRVSIESAPSGASVFIDGEYKGTTPLDNVTVRPGSYMVRLERARYEPWSNLVEFSPRSRKVRAELKSVEVCTLEIISDPPGAMVYVDGEARGNAPCTVSDLAPGGYEVMLKAEGYEPFAEMVEVEGGSRTLRAALISKYEQYFTEGIKKNPGELHNYIELAHHYMIRKKYDQALKTFANALQMAEGGKVHTSSDAVKRLYQEIAKVYVGWFDYADEKELNELRPRIDDMMRRSRGIEEFKRQVQSWERQKHPELRIRPLDRRQIQHAAIRELEEALVKNPNDVLLLVRLAELHLKVYNYKMAQEILTKAMSIAPQDYNVHRLMSDLYRALQQPEKAERELQIAAKLCQDKAAKADLHEKLALVYQTRSIGSTAAREWYNKAVEQWELSLQLTDDVERACRRRFTLALFRKRMGDEEIARKLFEEILQHSENEHLRSYARYLLKKN